MMSCGTLSSLLDSSCKFVVSSFKEMASGQSSNMDEGRVSGFCCSVAASDSTEDRHTFVGKVEGQEPGRDSEDTSVPLTVAVPGLGTGETGEADDLTGRTNGDEAAEGRTEGAE